MEGRLSPSGGIANQRKDAIHKDTFRLVKEHEAIFVGNVKAKAMGKSVDDVPNITQVRSHQAVRGTRRSQRNVFNPNVLVLRDHIR